MRNIQRHQRWFTCLDARHKSQKATKTNHLIQMTDTISHKSKTSTLRMHMYKKVLHWEFIAHQLLIIKALCKVMSSYSIIWWQMMDKRGGLETFLNHFIGPGETPRAGYFFQQGQKATNLTNLSCSTKISSSTVGRHLQLLPQFVLPEYSRSISADGSPLRLHRH